MIELKIAELSNVSGAQKGAPGWAPADKRWDVLNEKQATLNLLNDAQESIFKLMKTKEQQDMYFALLNKIAS